MIKVFCDKCGEPVNHKINGINVDFNHYGEVKFMETNDEHFQLCDFCAKKVVEFIKGEKIAESEK